MKCVLSDIADVTMGQSPKSEFYNSEGLGMAFLQGNRTFGKRYPVFDTYTTMPTKIAKAGDVIVSVRAPVGDLNFTPVDMCLGRGVCGIRMKNGNQDFLFYLLKYYMPQLINKESGTVFGSVNRNDINGLELEIPDDIEQQRIARVLTLFDDKIENNDAINENLSQQIQFIYDNLADGLTGDPFDLSTIIDVRDGTHDSPKAVEEGFPLVTSKHLLPYGVDLSTANLISKEDFDKTNERSLVETHDILISMIGTVGLISLVIDDPVPFAIKNVGLFKTSKCPELYAYILTYLRSTKTTQHIEKTLAGSTQKYISLGELRKMPIILPDENKLRDFNNIVVPLIMHITNLTEENKRLVELRDTLLPKLMSGELNVSELEL